MLKTIKMDLYRMFRSKSFYITLFITYILVIVSISTFKLIQDNDSLKSIYDQSKEASDSINVGITAGMIYIKSDELKLVDLFSATVGGASIVVMAVIYSVIFICSEHNSGYIKNVISRKGYRVQFTISKAICMAIYLLISLLGTAIFIGISSALLLDNYTLGKVSEFATYFIIQYLIHYAIVMLVVFFCNLTRNMAISMAVGICLCSGMVGLLTSLLDRLKFNIVFSDYLLTTNLKILPTSFNTTIYTRATLVSLVVTFVFAFSSVILMSKQDVR